MRMCSIVEILAGQMPYRGKVACIIGIYRGWRRAPNSRLLLGAVSVGLGESCGLAQCFHAGKPVQDLVPIGTQMGYQKTSF